MSKAEKSPKTSNTPQLRKDIIQAAKFLQNVTSSLEKLEATIADSETALSSERNLKEKIGELEKDATKLREENADIRIRLQQDKTLFAGATLKLADEFKAQLNQTELKHDRELQDLQYRIGQEKRLWQQKVEEEKAETRRFKASQVQGRREIESQLQTANANCEKVEERLRLVLQEKDRQIVELEEKVKALTRDLNNQKSISKGRETDLQVQRDRLASLEAFDSEDSKSHLTKLTALQEKIRDFCVRCVDYVETFPGWNRFPDGIRYNHLPQAYLSTSKAGRYILVAALQHSVCTVLKESIFVPCGPCTGPELGIILNALYQENQLHESICRLMSVNVILRDKQILSSSNPRLRGIADSLIVTWKLFQDKQQIIEVHEMMTKLLVESARAWLELMRLRSRIQVSTEVQSQYFDSDSEEETYTVPGGFKLPDSTSPILCLFPAFFWHATPDQTARPNLFRKGTAMFRDSPPLLVALDEELELSSPRMMNKKAITS